ncbi:META domain-containing protein [Agromyces sp. NPDC058484]|uniref:META domain-containing protein n=1 Tax=Agromyces sp. NPDC058484 TaxID=3346524 RepID=UPI0036476C06
MSPTLTRLTLTGTILLAAMLTACATNAGTDAAAPADPVGTWGDAGAPAEPSLGLASDGALTGTDGCNRLMGSWSDDAETITFEDVASTRMACPDVDTWLSALATGTIAGETLTVFDADGAEIGTLERTSDEEPSPEASGDATA